MMWQRRRAATWRSVMVRKERWNVRCKCSASRVATTSLLIAEIGCGRFTGGEVG
jgi:hypothetical protein